MGVALLIYYYKGVDTGILTQVIGLCLSSKFLYIFFLWLWLSLSLSLSLSSTMSTNNIGNAVTRFERGPWCVNWAGWPNRLVLYAPEFISLISIKALKESSQYEEFILIHLLLFWIFAELDLIIKQDYIFKFDFFFFLNKLLD